MDDLTGLGKPLTKLIECISKGVGAVAEPYLTRRMADAKAYEIRKIAQAVEGVSDGYALPVNFDNGKVLIKSEGDSRLIIDSFSADERLVERIGFQEQKRQVNIENITSMAAERLVDEEFVSEDPVSDDWITRFFDSAQSISSDEMQDLWSRVLSGEVAEPGSYSLRTIDYMRNITRSDALIIEKLAQVAVYTGKEPVLITNNNDVYFKQQQMGKSFFIDAVDLGLLHPQQLRFSSNSQSAVRQDLLIRGKLMLIIDVKVDSSPLVYDAWKFTKIGSELLRLVDVSGDLTVMENIGLHAAQSNCDVKLTKILKEHDGGAINYDVIKEITK